MMREIWKYQLYVNDELQELMIPLGGHIVSVECQEPTIVSIWVSVDTMELSEERQFKIFGTGHFIPDNFTYVGTAFDDPFVWHLFEISY